MADRKQKKKSETSKRGLTSICILGEPDFDKTGEFIDASKALGVALAARKIIFVYGGGIHSLRGNAAASHSIKGGKILSITVEQIEGRLFTLGEELKASSLPQRKGYMLYNADAFIALPGGLETLDGIFSITYWAKLNFHQKPLGLLNINDFYDGLLFFLDLAVEKGFIHQATRNCIISASTADELIDRLQAYAPQQNPFEKQVGGQFSNSSQKPEPDTTLRL